MCNPLKNRSLARLCTSGLKKSLCGGALQVGQGKGGKWTGRAGRFGGKGRVKKPPPARHEEGISGAVGKMVKEAGLGRDPEKKTGCGSAVSIKKSLNDPFGVTPGRPRPQGKGQEVAGHFFPGRHLWPNLNLAKVIKSHKDPVPPAKPLQNNRQPADNEPGSDKAFRVHANRCAIEALLTHLPALKRQKQGPDHCADRVLKVRDQLNRQEGKSPSLLPAQKPGNGDLLLPESGEQLNHMPPIRSDFSIAFRTIADGAHRPNRIRKVNLTGKKGFSVFPKGLEFVKVGKLNFSAALLTRRRALGSYTIGSASL